MILKQLLECLKGLKSTASNSIFMNIVADSINSHISNLGVLCHGRFVNMPLELIGHLHRNLYDDVDWIRNQSVQGITTAENSSNSKVSHKESASSAATIAIHIVDGVSQLTYTAQEETDMFKKMEYFVHFCRCTSTEKHYHSSSSSSSSSQQSAGSKSNEAFDVLGSSSALLFDQFEDEHYFQHAESAVLFRSLSSLTSSSSEVHSSPPLTVALLIPIKKLKPIVDSICAFTN